ncbi:MAG TPA: sigma-70 family RNA polymerase sigma factor [Tahibacter sp.]|nr:sigma-70 family RNA polymerase sigma factor [Tahibacter sp.]
MGHTGTTDSEQAAERPPENIDVELVARIAASDRQAETALVQRYTRAVRALLERRVSSSEIVDDLVQETFIVVIARARDNGIHDPSRIAGFLRQTAINLANSARRRMQTQRTDVSADEEVIENVADASDPLALAEEVDLIRFVSQMLDELPTQRDRELLRRYLVQGEDKMVICHDYGLNAEHFDRVMHRARTRLRDLIDRHSSSGELRKEPK